MVQAVLVVFVFKNSAKKWMGCACKQTHKSLLTVRSSRYMVFDKKSMPIVACKTRSASVGTQNNNTTGTNTQIWFQRLRALNKDKTSVEAFSSETRCCDPAGAPQNRDLLMKEGSREPEHGTHAQHARYLIGVVETVVHEPGDEGRLPNCANTTANGQSAQKGRETGGNASLAVPRGPHAELALGVEPASRSLA